MLGPLFSITGLLGAATSRNVVYAEEKDPVETAPPAEAPAETAPKKRRRRRVRNPGFYDDHVQEFKKVSDITCFNGGKFDFTYSVAKDDKQAACHFKAAMDGSIPGFMTLDTGVAFKTQGEKHVISAALDQNVNPKGKIDTKLDKRTTAHATFTSATQALSAEIKRKEPDACHSAKLDLGGALSTLSLTHMRSVTPSFTLGAELLHVLEDKTVVTGTARYKKVFKGPGGEKNHHGHCATLDLGSEGVARATYTLKVDPTLSLAADLAYSHLGALPGKQASVATASLRYDHDSFFMVAQLVPSRGIVRGFLETRINVAVSTVFSAEMDHFTDKNKFGVGVKISL